MPTEIKQIIADPTSYLHILAVTKDGRILRGQLAGPDDIPRAEWKPYNTIKWEALYGPLTTDLQ